jgi:putative ABC transport system permease protein
VTDSLYLAWRYVRHQRFKTSVLVGSITLILYLPLGLQVVVDRTAEQLSERARSTPLLVGRRGSALELALNSLYFEAETPETVPMSEVARVRDTGLAEAIPLHVRYRVREQPIVGTTIDYFAFRGLRPERGRLFAVLGECILGADAAEALEAGVGDSVSSTPETIFDLARVFSLRMKVRGVLERAYTPDDEAVFVEAQSAVAKREGNKITANPSVFLDAEITPRNVDTFHFHGDDGGFPLTAVLALPDGAKSKTLLLGKYLAPDEANQIIEPKAVMDELVATVGRVRSFVIAAVALVGGATLLTAVLVFLLSVRLRWREIDTMVKIGCSRGAIATLLACEVALVFGLSLVIACGLTAVTDAYGPDLIRGLIF